MNTKSIIITSFIGLFALSLGFVALSDSGRESSSTSQSTSIDETEHTTTPESTPRYEEFSESALATAEGQAVLFFHADWCIQCRQLETDFKQQGVPEGFTILKVDYDDRQDLRQKYGIRLQTSFVKVDTDGTAQSEPFVAYSEPTLAALKRDFLN